MASSQISNVRSTSGVHPTPVRVLILAPSSLVRARLERLIESDAAVELAGSVASVSEVGPAFAARTADVLLISEEMGKALLLLERLPGDATPVVLVVDEEPSRDFVSEALSHGVRGLVLAGSSSAELTAALRAVAAGLLSFSRDLAGSIADWLRSGARTVHDFDEAPESWGILPEHLTTREHEVLEMMMEGLSNKEIATQLNVSVHTVKFHISSIMGKLGASSRTEATTIGLRRGLITI
jgi:DNA-binding NarL/FixJ family response regulator